MTVSFDDGMDYSGRIVEYESSSQRYRIAYSDGDVFWHRISVSGDGTELCVERNRRIRFEDESIQQSWLNSACIRVKDDQILAPEVKCSICLDSLSTPIALCLLQPCALPGLHEGFVSSQVKRCRSSHYSKRLPCELSELSCSAHPE